MDSKISRLLGDAEASTIDFLFNSSNTGKFKGIIRVVLLNICENCSCKVEKAVLQKNESFKSAGI